MIRGRKCGLHARLPMFAVPMFVVSFVAASLFAVSIFAASLLTLPQFSSPLFAQTSTPSLSTLNSVTTPDELESLINIESLNNIDEEVIYLDGDGTIRVLDTNPGSDGAITWSSPVAGFEYLAAGDFNLDGDDEVVAARNVNDAGQIVIYDPVVSDASVAADGRIGNVPWKTLDTINLDGEITVLDVGDLNLALAGDEILVVMKLENGGTGVRIYSSADQSIDGVGWQVHIEADFAWEWDAAAIGNIDGEKTDEVVLLSSRNISDSNTSRLHVYQVDTTSLASKTPIVTRDLTTISWKSAAIGEVKNLGAREIVVVGDADGNINNNIHVFSTNLDAGTMDYVDTNDRDSVAPDPSLTFLADVTGIVNNQRDMEMFFLRSVPSDNTSSPRFFARNQGNDSFDADLFDLALDADNGWQAGTGADVDGDAKDEIVLMRDNAIRVYTAPDEGTDLASYQTNNSIPISTDSTNVLGANLDRNGVPAPLRFEATISGLESGLEPDEVGTFTIQVDSDEPVAFTAALPTTKPGWVNSLSPLSGQSPANLALTVSTAGLTPGEYTTTVTVTPSGAAVESGAIEIPVTLVVLDNSFSVGATQIKGVYSPCQPPFLRNTLTNMTVTATTTATFTAVVLPEDASENGRAHV